MLGLSSPRIMRSSTTAEVEVHLSGILRLELAGLRINNHVPPKLHMVEEQIEVEVLLRRTSMRLLAAEKGEPLAELQQKLSDVVRQAFFESALFRILLQREELEVVGILEKLMSQIGLGRGQGAFEVRDGFSLPGIEVALDLVNQDVAAPAVFRQMTSVPKTLILRLQFVEKNAVVPPGNFCNSLLQNCLIRPSLGERAHVAQVPQGESGHVGKLAAKVGCDALDDFGPPALFLHSPGDVPADAPVKQNQFAVDGERGAYLRRSHSLLDVANQFLVARRHLTRLRQVAVRILRQILFHAFYCNASY